MHSLTERYLNFFTDFGFKKLFGEEPNKDLLCDFLNQLLAEEGERILDLRFLKNEKPGTLATQRGAVFDLYCENDRGEKLIVEIQQTKQKFFKERSLYYATFPIQEQAEREDWDFGLNKVYTVAILDFVFDEDRNDPHKFKYLVKLSDIETKRVFYDKLSFVYLEMPKFQKSLKECESRFDKWLYLIKNLHRLSEIPEELNESLFLKLFQTAEVAKLTVQDYRLYEDSLKVYRDLNNTLNTAKKEAEEQGWKRGWKEGWKENRKEVALKALQEGFDVEMVCKITGLSAEEIEKLSEP